MLHRQQQAMAITITITIGMRALSLLEGERGLGVAGISMCVNHSYSCRLIMIRLFGRNKGPQQ